MNSFKNKITIGITAYKEGEYLLEAWDSVINQTINNWETIMILDGGSDIKTENIFDDISHPSLRKIKLEENNGPYHCRTLAINNTNTKWYCHLDGDDRLPLNTIKKVIDAISINPKIEYIWGKSLYFNKNNFYVRDNKVIEEKKMAYTLPITGTSPINLDLFNKIGGYNKNLYSGGADWDFWIGVVESGAIGFYLDEILYERRLRTGSVGDSWVNRRHEVAKIIIENHSDFFSDQKLVASCLSKSYELSAREYRRIGLRNQAAILAKKAIDFGNNNPNLYTMINESKMPFWRYKLRRIARMI